MLHTDPIVEKIIVARIGLLLRHPFFGNLATRLIIKDASDWCKTAATDGRHLFYSREFFETKTAKEIEFIVGHEILHNVFDHIARTETRNPQLWNVAIDYTVNGQLVRDRIGDRPKGINIYHDSKHYGKSAEQIYDELLPEADNQELSALGQLLDEHIDWSAEADGAGSSKPSYTKDQLRQIRDEVREATIAAAQAAGAGNTPAEVQRMIKELTEPKMNWRQILRQQIQSTIRNDYTWARPSRKGWHTGAVLPGMNFDETIDLAISLDMSGSISDAQAREFLSEIKGIMDEYKDFKIKLWCFDTKVYNEQDFDGQGNSDIVEYELAGGGGTDFEVNWNYMKENDITPKKFIMFTDGYTFTTWGDESYCDTVFIIHGNTRIVPPFGVHAYYDENK